MRNTMRTMTMTLALAAGLTLAGAAGALEFQHAFDVSTGPYGPDRAAAGEGTPRGVGVTATGNVLIADSLDDQIYEVDPNGAFVRNMQTNPYCELSGPPTCLPGVPEHSAGFATGLAVQPGTGHLWLLDDPNTGGTILHELDANGLFLNEFDIGFIVGANTSGLTFDTRNGDLLILELSGGSNRIVRLDENDPEDFLSVLEYNIPVTSGPQGITAFDSDTFLVVDAQNDALYEFNLPTGAGSATLEGTSTLLDFDLSTKDALGVEYDPVFQRLYISNNNLGDPLHVFNLVPEPGTGSLLALGLLALAARRRRAG